MSIEKLLTEYLPLEIYIRGPKLTKEEVQYLYLMHNIWTSYASSSSINSYDGNSNDTGCRWYRNITDITVETFERCWYEPQ